MTTPREDFRRYMNALDEPPTGNPASVENHPDQEGLLAYLRESVTKEEKAGIEAHLSECALCAEAFSDLRDFFEPRREGETEASEIEIAREWKSLSRRLPGRTASSWIPSRSTLALAASVVLAVGLGVSTLQLDRENRELGRQLSTRESRVEELQAENRRLQESGSRSEAELAELKHPRANTHLFDLFSREWVQRSSSSNEIAEISIPREAGNYVLILSGEGQPRAGEHVLEILDREGKTVWRGEGLRRDLQGSLVITLDRSFLKDGEYRLVLYGKRGNGVARVAEYPVRVKHQ